MELELTELIDLVNKPAIENIENSIAKKMNFTIYKDNFDKIIHSLKKEIGNSGLKLEKIAEFIATQPQKIEEFSILFLKNENPEMLSIGFSLNYAIYIIYLIEKSEEDLYDFIVLRRIPQAKKVVKQLMDIKKKMNIGDK
jgi:hypothetical protein